MSDENKVKIELTAEQAYIVREILAAVAANLQLDEDFQKWRGDYENWLISLEPEDYELLCQAQKRF